MWYYDIIIRYYDDIWDPQLQSGANSLTILLVQ